MSVGIGMSAGMLLSHLFLELFGSPAYAFYFFAPIYFVLMKVCACVLPDLKSENKKVISYTPFMTNP